MFTISTIILIIAYCACASSAFETDLDFSQNREVRPNHGVIFQPLNRKLMVTSSVYNLILTIERPKWSKYLPCLGNLKSINMIQFCNILSPTEKAQYEDLTRTINEAQAGIALMLHSPLDINQNDTRNPRALLGFVGKISRSLFGTATTGDVARLAAIVNNAVEKINRQGDATSEQFHLLQVALTSASQAIRDSQNGVILNFNMLRNFSRKFSNISQTLREEIRDVADHVIGIEKYVNEILARKMIIFDRLQQVAIITDNFLQALTALNNGYLSYHFVSPTILEQNLARIQAVLDRRYPGHKLAHTDLTYYYNGHHLTHYTYTASHIIIHVQVPFALESALFNVYSVQSFPVPIKPTDPTSLGFTTLPNLSQYIATSTDGTRYTELNAAQFALCENTRIMTCPMVHTIRRRPLYTCTASVFYHNVPSFMSTCQPLVYPHLPIPTTIHSLSQNSFLITTNVSQYELSCQGQALIKKDCHAYAVVEVPCSCSLYMGDLSVTPSLTGCDDTESSFKISHPINYALFLSFDFEPYQFESLQLSNSSVTLDIPDIEQYVSNFTDLNDKMIADGLQLKQVSDAILEARHTYERDYQNLDAALTFLPYTEDPNYVAIFSLVIMAVLIGLIIVSVTLGIKIRKLDLALAAATASSEVMTELLPQANATFISKPTSLPTPTPLTIVSSDADHVNYTLYLSLTIMAILTSKIVINLTTKLYHKLRNWIKINYYGSSTEGLNTPIALLFINDNLSVFLRVSVVPIPNAIITNCLVPKVAGLTITGSWCKYLHITWQSRLSVCTGTANHAFTMPNKIRLSRVISNKFKQMLKNQSRLQVVLTLEEPLRFISALKTPSIYTPNDAPVNYNKTTCPPPYNQTQVTIEDLGASPYLTKNTAEPGDKTPLITRPKIRINFPGEQYKEQYAA